MKSNVVKLLASTEVSRPVGKNWKRSELPAFSATCCRCGNAGKVETFVDMDPKKHSPNEWPGRPFSWIFQPHRQKNGIPCPAYAVDHVEDEMLCDLEVELAPMAVG